MVEWRPFGSVKRIGQWPQVRQPYIYTHYTQYAKTRQNKVRGLHTSYENRNATVAPLVFRFSYFVFRRRYEKRKTENGFLYRKSFFVRRTEIVKRNTV